MQEKKELRKVMLSKRSSLDPNQKEQFDKSICTRIAALIDQNNFTRIHTFLPMGDEVNLFPLISMLLSKNCTLICPKSLPKRKMENRILYSLHELENGVFGTKHPANKEAYLGKIDLIIVPGLAFDSSFNRLGYGAGYYDTFLATQQDVLKLGVCYPFQVIDDVPKEAHDVPLDMLYF